MIASHISARMEHPAEGTRATCHVTLKSMSGNTVLYRPVGEKELELIRAADWRGFPPRLPEQPIFYPVLEESYAVQIARDWNTRDSGTGYVLRFKVETDYLSNYPVQIAGLREHREYWQKNSLTSTVTSLDKLKW